MLEADKKHKGTTFIKTGLIIKCFLENVGKKLTYDDIGEYLAKHGCKPSYWSIASIIYHISSIYSIVEGKDNVTRWFIYEGEE